MAQCNMLIPAKDLKLGDIVKLETCLWDTCIVKQISEHEVTLFRPYGTTANFTYTGGVICYIGLEEYRIPRDARPYRVMQREELA